MPPTTPRTGRRTGTPPRCTPRPAGWPPGWAGGPMPRARSGPRTPRSWPPRPPRTAGGWPGSGPPPRRRPDPRPRPPSGASTWLPSGPPWPSVPAAGVARTAGPEFRPVAEVGGRGSPSLTGRGLRAVKGACGNVEAVAQGAGDDDGVEAGELVGYWGTAAPHLF